MGKKIENRGKSLRKKQRENTASLLMYRLRKKSMITSDTEEIFQVGTKKSLNVKKK